MQSDGDRPGAEAPAAGASARLELVDALRGFALLGVAVWRSATYGTFQRMRA